MSENYTKYTWVTVYITVFIWSAIEPKDYFTWGLEVAPAVIGAAVLLFTYKQFKLTGVLYVLILLHCIVLMVGGHHTYAEVPLFDAIKEMFSMSRNQFDKVGHFMQGLVPALIAREVIIRKAIIRSSRWRTFFIICFCLALSAFYELIEWWVALLTGEDAEAFLGTQGYVWDTQSDMMFALIGAITGLVLLAKLHDKQLDELKI